MTTVTEPTTPDDPADLRDVETPEPTEKPKKAKPDKAPPADRGELDPITTHLWRYKRPVRRTLLLPFEGRRVKLERWFGRVAANGDQTYRGTLLAVAETTIGSAADLVILRETDGTTWAISTAQVAYIELEQPVAPRKRARVTAAEKAAAHTQVVQTAVKTTRRRKAAEVPDASTA